MCGIWSYIKLKNNKNCINRYNLYEDFMKIKNRGPEYSSFNIYNNDIYIGFHRLSIMNLDFNANQPYIIQNEEKTIIFICNGEIYNFNELNVEHNLNISDNSDCLTIPKLYLKYSYNDFIKLFINNIKGEFAFLLYEFDKMQNLKNLIIGRDTIGIRPLYYHHPTEYSNALIFSSEIKGMTFFEENISEFQPGQIININMDNLNINTFNYTTLYNIQSNFNYDINEKLIYLYLDNIKKSVINSIKRRLISDRPIAFLLSGGVDSSLIASLASQLIDKPIYTYCCGFEGGTDLEYAKKVAKHIGSIHTEVYLNPDECLESIKDVIYTIETWDTTTIRASVGQYLISKYISNNSDAKVVMVGEGPDEVCSSYLFNFYAPNGNELHETAIDYVKKIHMNDGRRADRCISNWGLEARIALLDPEFISAYWEIPSEWRHPKYDGFNNIIKNGFNNNIEKWWLRKAFEDSNILPSEVLWRKKEAFSDGISKKNKSWFEMINDYIYNNQKNIVDNYIKSNEFPSIEAFYYKTIFRHYFNNRDYIIPNYWQPKWINNNNEYIDPSARILDVYND